MWSPQGTYLTTFHVPGIALWGGERFEKQGRFPHKDVKVCLYFRFSLVAGVHFCGRVFSLYLFVSASIARDYLTCQIEFVIRTVVQETSRRKSWFRLTCIYFFQVVEFSPCETYVMTCNFQPGDKAIIVWEVLTGQMLRAFPMETTMLAGKIVQAVSTTVCSVVISWAIMGQSVLGIGNLAVKARLDSRCNCDPQGGYTSTIVAFKYPATLFSKPSADCRMVLLPTCLVAIGSSIEG